jgi:hypothetical protein
MATTATQSKAPADTANIAVGRYIIESGDTAAAITITTGFLPRYVRVQNVTSGDGMEWFEGMAAASAQKQVAAGDKTLITSLGITASASGFIIGLDTDVNVKAEQLSWIAIG